MRAIQLTDSKPVMGRRIPVYNKKRRKFSTENVFYYAVWTEDSKGNGEECLLFTERELERARERAQRNPEDWTERSLLTDVLD
jgi:hypothetical protein